MNSECDRKFAISKTICVEAVYYQYLYGCCAVAVANIKMSIFS